MAVDWIRMDAPDPEKIEEEVREGLTLAEPCEPQACEVVITRHPSGYYVLIFSEKLAPVEFVNLFAWLVVPPDSPGTAAVAASFTSPADGAAYRLWVAEENTGLTFVGQSSSGLSVEVYIPTAEMCEKTRSSSMPETCVIAQEELNEVGRFAVTIEGSRDWGNPGFVITHPKDYDWHPSQPPSLWQRFRSWLGGCSPRAESIPTTRSTGRNPSRLSRRGPHPKSRRRTGHKTGNSDDRSVVIREQFGDLD